MYELKEFPLFSALDNETFSQLKKHISIKKFYKENIIFYEGDKSQYIYFLIEGEIKMYMTSPKGIQVQIHRLFAPDIFGEYICFQNKPFPLTCEMVTDGKIGLLHFNDFCKFLNNYEFSFGLLCSISNKIMLLSSLIKQETLLSAEAKTAKLLLKNPTIFNKIKNIEIANILNIKPETLSRILSKLKKTNVISYQNNRIKILDKKALQLIIKNNSIKDIKNI